ncbi:prenylcysteine oxidase [Coniochaeta sp. 2T2.1]|nr:prenylcysteine oxidase [Coniochaeta sp. 2T2.1]
MLWPRRLVSLTALTSLTHVSVVSSSTQASSFQGQEVRNVAIIGAGAAGSSTAYYLKKYADEYDLAVNITLFEKADRIGGRTLTIDPFDINVPHESVELGASIFIKNNAILYNTTREFGLATTTCEEDGVDGILAFWDGEKVRFDIDSAHSEWRTTARLVWRYGYFALKNSQALMRKTMDKFLNLYEPPYFPFKSLTQSAYELGLLEEASSAGEEFLRKNKIPILLSQEFIQALTRVNYASNLAYIHGLETMVSTAAEGALSVVGGNWRIFDKMVQASGAAFLLNTSVCVVALHSTTDHPSVASRYTINTRPSGEDSLSIGEVQRVVFDDVVVATPYQFSKMRIGLGHLENRIDDDVPYITLHVTIFSSPLRLSAEYFKVAPHKVPTTVLTTLAEGESPLSGWQGAGQAGFYSISTLKMVINPKTGREEYLYKIFSPLKVTPKFLSELFGVKIPDTFVGEIHEDGQTVEPISWYYPHVFHSYPKPLPRVTFQDPVVAPGLYYTSGMESLISTMETNALMGKNVARLIIDDMLSAQKERNVLAEDLGETGDQQVLQDL